MINIFAKWLIYCDWTTNGEFYDLYQIVQVLLGKKITFDTSSHTLCIVCETDTNKFIYKDIFPRCGFATEWEMNSWLRK